MTRVEGFVRLSAALTGFTAVELWGTGQVEAYLRWVEEHSDPATLGAFLDRAAGPLDEAALADLLAAAPLNLLAKQINYLWYTAQWQELKNGALVPTAIVSPAAYQEALVWPAFLSHPPGAKQPGFASWSRLPGRSEES